MTRLVAVKPGTPAWERVRMFLRDNDIPTKQTPLGARIRFQAGSVVIEQLRTDRTGERIVTTSGFAREDREFPLKCPPDAYDLPLEEES